MKVMYSQCAGLDVHKKTVVACRMRTDATGDVEPEIRTFGTTTRELLEMSDWLMEWEVSHVAMESTGEYWKPIYNLLEGNVEVLLVNAKHVKHVPGRKTDVKDAEWLAELLRHGLLRGSFVPPQAQRDLRDLTRYRTRIVRERTRQVNRLQRVLEGANIKLSAVATDILGKSGRAMLDALAAGETDAAKMADLARGLLRKKLPDLEQALTGRMRPHHQFLLQQHLKHLDFLDEQIVTLSQELERQMAAVGHERRFSGESKDSSRGTHSGDSSALEPLSAQEAVGVLDTIPGVNQRTAEVIVAELGTDMTRFPTANHAAAWAGVAPGNHESAGKRYSGRTRDGNQALQDALCEAAWAASRTKNTYLSTLYRRLVGRRGKKRAIVAVAHSILVSAYYMLSRHEVYHDLGTTYFDTRKKASVVNRLLHRLEKLGMHVTIEPTAVPAVG
ncbi:IS110 family transposase [Sedimenticola sp.]|uniref:IS110 family transposase n=1 Tax=Sedimenticola sp. TaxID=1940285 RepID=UPI003D0CFEE7